ncbi:TPA: hypothetical protein ACW72O_003475 [Elizabethkingia anophelis]|uniref:hypothetical protein n=1 Tax=Elizabethkingia anophelis TaxID=1117645 RepID=UPI00131A4775|nr:hypothetical protein [Elizabethkingia anophelis]MCL1691979.1 hypothetical protein [Elizabethkingia anophelis]
MKEKKMYEKPEITVEFIEFENCIAAESSGTAIPPGPDDFNSDDTPVWGDDDRVIDFK